jgi:hypothetical protein
MMQYKVSPTDSVWSPINGSLIKLWKVNSNGLPKLPTKVPSPIPYHLIWDNDAFKSMKREKFINVGLFKYVEFQKQGIE